MTDFEISVYKDTDIIGAEVKVISESGEVIDSIEIVDAEDLAALQSTITNITNNYASKTYLTTTLENTSSTTTINATKLAGKNGSEYSLANHTHDTYAPKNHAASSGEYGTGTEMQYGHVRTVNSLLESSYVSGRSLSAYQGRVLDDKITALNTDINNKFAARGGYIKYSPTVQKGSNFVAQCYYADGTPVKGKKFKFIINNADYQLTSDNDGKISMQINLEQSKIYPIIVHINETSILASDIFTAGAIYVWV